MTRVSRATSKVKSILQLGQEVRQIHSVETGKEVDSRYALPLAETSIQRVWPRAAARRKGAEVHWSGALVEL